MKKESCLFIYHFHSGKGHIHKKIPYIKKRLERIFKSLRIEETKSRTHLLEIVSKGCGVYDVIVFAGGDGTFNDVLNAVMQEKKQPILGYLPFGTINDAGKSFGVTKNCRKALNIIEKGNIVEADCCIINNRYFSYMSALGAYADISYVTKQNKKKRLGRLAYYFMALRNAFKNTKIKISLHADGVDYGELITPFVLIMNGGHVGGFSVNHKYMMDDRKVDVFVTKPGLFNGLLHYLFFKVKTTHIKAKELIITTNEKCHWCIDGEKGFMGNAIIKISDKKYHIFAKPKQKHFLKNIHKT